ncbi:MAG: glycosyltransferase [Candidatus Aenigmarchaeota archaeon]|nr:glycosyltransferase [Candidatus Aenigmarchaeota archaeon]
MKNSYSIVIPAYNEEKRIGGTLESYFRHFKKSGMKFEIIVVCDGSDTTASIVKNFMKLRKGVRLIEFGRRLGKGRAVMEGLKHAAGDVVGFTDADGSVGPDNFLSMMEICRKSVDCIVIGSRNMEKSFVTKKQPAYRQLLSNVFSHYVNMLFGLGITDTQCGAKVMTRKMLSCLDGMKSAGFEFDAEMLWRIKKIGGKIIEFPVKWSHNEFSTFRVKTGPRMALKLMSIRLMG